MWLITNKQVPRTTRVQRRAALSSYRPKTLSSANLAAHNRQPSSSARRSRPAVVAVGAAEFVALTPRCDASAHRVSIDVLHQGAPVSIVLERLRKEPASNQGTVTAVDPIEAQGVCVLGQPQRLAQLPPGATHLQVEVRREEAVGVNLEPPLPDVPGQPREKEPDVGAVLEHRALRDATIDDVVSTARCVLPRLSSHPGKEERKALGFRTACGSWLSAELPRRRGSSCGYTLGSTRGK